MQKKKTNDETLFLMTDIDFERGLSFFTPFFLSLSHSLCVCVKWNFYANDVCLVGANDDDDDDDHGDCLCLNNV
jgi:hypothetical protein